MRVSFVVFSFILFFVYLQLRRVDRVILLNWHVKILEKQIEFGAQLGDTVLQLARMELKNYNKNVLAVAEYFDQLGKLSVVRVMLHSCKRC